MYSNFRDEILQMTQEFRETNPEQEPYFLVRKYFFTKLQEAGLLKEQAQRLAQQMNIRVSDEAYQRYKDLLYPLLDAAASATVKLNAAYLTAGLGELQDVGFDLVLE
jgi:hypothetical protein